MRLSRIALLLSFFLYLLPGRAQTPTSTNHGNKMYVHAGAKIVIHGTHEFKGVIGADRTDPTRTFIGLKDYKTSSYSSGTGVDGYLQYVGARTDVAIPITGKKGSTFTNSNVKIILSSPSNHKISFFSADPQTSAKVSKYIDFTGDYGVLPVGGSSTASNLFTDGSYSNPIYNEGYWAVTGSSPTKVKFEWTTTLGGGVPANGAAATVIGWSKALNRWEIIPTKNSASPTSSLSYIETISTLIPNNYAILTLANNVVSDLAFKIKSIEVGETIAKTSFVGKNNKISFVISLRNNGPDDVALPITFKSFFPTGMSSPTFKSAVAPPGIIVSNSINTLSNGEEILFSVNKLNVGQEVTITVEAIYASINQLTVELTDIQHAGAQDSNRTPDVTRLDLEKIISNLDIKIAGSTIVKEDTEQTFTVTIANGNASNDVDISVPFDIYIDLKSLVVQKFSLVTSPNNNITYAYLGSAIPSPTSTFTVGGNLPSGVDAKWTIPFLKKGQTAILRYTVTVPDKRVGSLLETDLSLGLEVDSSSSNDVLKFSSIVQFKSSDLKVEIKKLGLSQLLKAKDAEYKVTVSNLPGSNSEKLENVKLFLNIDSSVQTMVSSNPNSGTFQKDSSGKWVWNIPVLNIGDTFELTYKATTSNSATVGQSVTNSIEFYKPPNVTSSIDNTDNNDILAITLNVVDIDVEIKVISSKNTAYEGQDVLFTITVVNRSQGDYVFNNLQYTFDIDKSFIIKSSNITGQGTFNSGTGVWDIGNLSAGVSTALQINTDVPDIDNSLDGKKMGIKLTKSSHDRDFFNKTSIFEDSVVINDQIDLRMQLSSSEKTLVDGQFANVAFVIDNNGPSPVSNIKIQTNFNTVVPNKNITILPLNAATYDSSTGIILVSKIISGQSVSLRYFFDTPKGQSKILNFRVNSVSSNRIDNDKTPDVLKLDLPVNHVSSDLIDLYVTTTANKSKIARIEVFTYTITVENFGRDSAKDLNILIRLSNEVDLNSFEITKGNFNNKTDTWSMSSLSPDDGKQKLVLSVRVNKDSKRSNAICNVLNIGYSNNPVVNYQSFTNDLTEVVQVELQKVVDTDGDGIPDKDEDLNKDGNYDNDDTDGNGIPNYLDSDDDGDSVPTKIETKNSVVNGGDTDGDGIPDYLDNDDDNDGKNTKNEIGKDTDGKIVIFDNNGNGIPDYLENGDVDRFELQDEHVEVNDIFTPNKDGINDSMSIYNIQLYPENTVAIYNSWGMEVYSTKGYGTNTSKLFKGIGPSGEILTEGVYFYLLKFKIFSGKEITRTGSVYLKR